MWPFKKTKPDDGSLNAEVMSAIEAASIMTRHVSDDEGKPRLLISLRFGQFHWNDQEGIAAAMYRAFPDLSAPQVARALRMLHNRVIQHARNEMEQIASQGNGWRDSWRPLKNIMELRQ